MFFSNTKVQSNCRTDSDVAARYLAPEFDIERAESLPPTPAAPPPSPSPSQRETALIHQRERPATPPARALVCPVPQRGRGWLTRAQARSAQTASPVAQGQDVSHLSAAERRALSDVSLTPDYVPDTMTVAVCALASVGGLIGGLAAAYIKK